MARANSNQLHEPPSVTWKVRRTAASPANLRTSASDARARCSALVGRHHWTSPPALLLFSPAPLARPLLHSPRPARAPPGRLAPSFLLFIVFRLLGRVTVS